MFGRFLLSGVILFIYTVILVIFNLNPISYLVLIGALLVLGFLPMGQIVGALGVISCTVGSALLWGLGGFLLAGGLAVNLYLSGFLGSGDPFDRAPISYARWFPIAGHGSTAAAILGAVILIVRFIVRLI